MSGNRPGGTPGITGIPATSASKLLDIAMPKKASQSAGWRSDETSRVLNLTNLIMSRQ